MSPSQDLLSKKNGDCLSLKKPGRFTRQAKSDALNKGLITGHFGVVHAGRPKKVQVQNTQQPITITAQVTRAKLACTRIQWNSEKFFPILKASVLAKLKGQDLSEDLLVGSVLLAPIDDRTMKRTCEKFKTLATSERIELENITREMVYRATKNKGLLESKGIAVIQDIIVCRDDANNGMSRDEAITLVSQLSQCFDRLKCEQHWNYLVAKKKMPKLKAGGRVKKAQNTTIKRTQIHVEQQLRFHPR